MFLDEVESELGDIVLAGSETELSVLDFSDCRDRMTSLMERRWPGVSFEQKAGFGGFGDRVRAYFAGDLQAFDSVKIAAGGTSFEEEVWDRLRRIAPGTTATYGELATDLGRPGGARAVGRANARNPIALVVPCHRVIGGDGSLTGYAGGVGRKKLLLEHEGCWV